MDECRSLRTQDPHVRSGVTAPRRMPLTVVILGAAVTSVACGAPASNAAAPSSATAPAVTSAAPTISAVSTAPATAAATDAPVAGQCWTATESDLSSFVWTGSPAGDCGVAHNAETLYVGKLAKAADAPYTTVPYDYQVQVETACASDTRLSALFGQSVTVPGHWWIGSDPRPGVTAAVPLDIGQPSFYFPSADQWAAGARWFRCDVGSPVTPAWREAPSRFASVLASDPDFFRFCAPGKKPSGSTQVVSNDVVNRATQCSAKTPWRLVLTVALATTPSEGYPGSAVVLERAQAACPAHPSARYSVPNELSWDTNGITSADCWQYGH